jgi:large subunit ribosomal protein L15
MELNTIKPAAGSRKPRKRVGRASARAWARRRDAATRARNRAPAAYHKVGFEGGQMPLQRRLPKRGFAATTITKAAEVRSGDLAKVGAAAIDLDGLKKAGLVPADAERAKIILAGKVEKSFKVSGILASKGAKAAIEQAGGSVAAVERASASASSRPRPTRRKAQPEGSNWQPIRSRPSASSAI